MKEGMNKKMFDCDEKIASLKQKLTAVQKDTKKLHESLQDDNHTKLLKLYDIQAKLNKELDGVVETQAS